MASHSRARVETLSFSVVAFIQAIVRRDLFEKMSARVELLPAHAKIAARFLPAAILPTPQ
jgi:hypothetical protein